MRPSVVCHARSQGSEVGRGRALVPTLVSPNGRPNLSLREFAASNSDVLKAMNTTPLFWLTTHHAMLLSAFIGLGRIFDPSSAHNIDTLRAIASKDLDVFSKAALAKRKMAAGREARFVSQRR